MVFNQCKTIKTIKIMSRFITAYNYDPSMHKGEINEMESETIEGQALTVTEVLIRYSRGTLPNIQFPTYYDEVEDFDADDPTLRPDFDLSDTDNIQEYIDYLQTKKQEIEADTPVDGPAVLADQPTTQAEGA
ncbi:MAG: hypothetical protein QXJ97_11275 [Desulfurococcaceae archaeon]